MKFSVIRYQVQTSDIGERIDKVLANHPEIRTRTRAANLIAKGWTSVNGKSPRNSYRVLEKDVIDVQIPEFQPTRLEPVPMHLDILYEDDDLIVVNKPAGLVVHPSLAHENHSLVHGLLHHCKKLSMGFNEMRPGIVHRLDKDTSGTLVVAKTDVAHQALAAQFKDKTVRRIYKAVTFGVPSPLEGTARSFLRRHPNDRKKFYSSPDKEGKLAITHYKTLANYHGELSLLQCQLETGRTHQIRVHMSERHCPIIGDTIYGAKRRIHSLGSGDLREQLLSLNRIGLHAEQLGFIHPTTQKQLFFQVGWPHDIIKLIETLGFAKG